MFRYLNRYNSCQKTENIRQVFVIKYCLECVRTKSYYHVLGLNSDATGKEIKSAYYELSLRYHPDKNSGCPAATAKFREITEAYEVLGNPEKKKVYDQRGSFQAQTSQSQTYRGSYYHRPQNYRGPYTGKTQDFDYDEHFRKHYQEYEKQRQAEHEYFRRRWEAEFYRRYPKAEDYYRKAETEKQDGFQEFSRRYPVNRKASYIFLLSLWFTIFIFQAISDLINPEAIRKRTSIYYRVKEEDEKELNDKKMS